MRVALTLAKQAARLGEVPIGAIVLFEGKVVGRGFNLRETEGISLRHAELIAIEEACRSLGSWRLTECELFVTLEPCLMCAGGIYQSRMRRVIFGASDPKGGATGSLYEIHRDVRLNHRFFVTPGVLSGECAQLLKDFFAMRSESNFKN